MNVSLKMCKREKRERGVEGEKELQKKKPAQGFFLPSHPFPRTGKKMKHRKKNKVKTSQKFLALKGEEGR